MSPMLSSHDGGGAWPGGLCVPLAGLGSKKYLFGDGSYSGNIIQDGVALQPQDYLLDGITPLTNCIVVTNTATIEPDATTGASAATGRNLVVVGASASLSPSTNSKGLILLFSVGIHVRSGGRIHIDKLGKAGNFGNLTVLDLVPQSIKRKLKGSLASYVVMGEGAAGGAPIAGNNGYIAGNSGIAASSMQTGGGGTGECGTYPGPYGVGRGGKGGPCCGGAGSGGNLNGYAYTPDAGDYGGPGGNALGQSASYTASGGAGDPIGTSNNGNPGEGAGGGLLMLFTPLLYIASGCIVSADGAKAGAYSGTYCCPGGSAGGGCVVIVTNSGGYMNNGTVRAAGGASVSGYIQSGGPGGAGSVNTFAIAA